MKNTTIYDEMVYKIIIEMESSNFTVAEIFRFCVAKKYEIPQSMIYKAIVNLVKTGKIQKITSDERSCRYEKCDGGKNVKIVCSTCHRELKIYDQRIDMLLVAIAIENKKKLEESNLTIYVSHINDACKHN